VIVLPEYFFDVLDNFRIEVHTDNFRIEVHTELRIILKSTCGSGKYKIKKIRMSDFDPKLFY